MAEHLIGKLFLAGALELPHESEPVDGVVIAIERTVLIAAPTLPMYQEVAVVPVAELRATEARVKELEAELEMQTTRCIEREERLEQADACILDREKRNAELVGALHNLSPYVVRLPPECRHNFRMLVDAALARNAAYESAKHPDSVRLDWLALTDHWFDEPCDGKWTPETLRAAIDAARKEAHHA